MRPFARASAVFALIAAAMQLGPAERIAAMGGIPSYKSRGKGGKSPRRATGILRAQRASLKAKNVARNRKAHR